MTDRASTTERPSAAWRIVAAGYVAGATAGFGFGAFFFVNPYIALALFLCGAVVYPLTIRAGIRGGNYRG